MDDFSPTPPAGFKLDPPTPAPEHVASTDVGIAPPPGFTLDVPKPPASQAQDIVQGAGRGLIEGGGSILGMPADLWHMLDRGYQNALSRGAEKLGLLTPEQSAALREPIGEVEKPALNSDVINRHLLGVAKTLGADTSEPTTGAGKATETVASFLPSAATMGGTTLPAVGKSLLKYGLAPGAASEAAGEATAGTEVEPYARAAGAILGSGPAIAMDIAAAHGAARSIGQTLRNVTEPQFTAAQNLLNESRAAGAPLTLPEAVQHATNGATNLGDVQRVVEQSAAGGPTMKSFYGERPGQTQALGQQALDQITPARIDPAEVAPRVQGAAEGVVGRADRGRSQAVKPLYTSAAADEVPVDEMNAFLDKIDGMVAADKTGLISPQLAKLRDALTETPAANGQSRVPITDIENLDNARKYFRDQINQPAIAKDAIPKQVGAKMGSLLDELRGMMENSSGDFVAGKQRYQQITNNTVNPLLRSPTGQLANADTFDRQAAILFNPNPLPNSQAAVGRAVREIARSDPEAAQHLVRLNLERSFNEATQNNMAGPNQWGGAKFAAVTAGNPQQATNLEAAVRALPNGDTRWAAMDRALRIMQAQGRRQPVGSQTEFNRMLNVDLRQGSPIGEVAAAAGSPSRLARLVSDAYDNFRYRRNTADLARLFTTGNVDDLRALASAPVATARGQAALVAALARQGANGASPNPGP